MNRNTIATGIHALRHYLTRPRISSGEQVALWKRLAFVLHAGVPLAEGLALLATETRMADTKAVLTQMRDDIIHGHTVSQSAATFPHLFDRSTIHIIATGEMTGTLAQTCTHLADLLMKQSALRQKIVGALVYPAIIAAVMFGVIGFLMLYLFPKIMPIFTSLHMQLPFATRLIIAMSTFCMQWGVWCAALLMLGTLAVVVTLRKNERAQLFVHRLALRLPLFGTLLRNHNLINASRMLQLLTPHLTLHVTLTRIAESSTHLGYRHVWNNIAQAVETGQSLAQAMRHDPHYFPGMYIQIIAAGERSGMFSETMSFLETWYEHDTDERIKRMSTLIEPCMMIVMGLLVGFIALSIIMPIYNITQSLHA